MTNWRIYKRGNKYRIGQPGFFGGISWLHILIGGLYDEVWSSESIVDAQRKLKEVNVRELERELYKRECWTVVESDDIHAG